MSRLVERIRFAVVLAGISLLALPANALAAPGDAVTQATAGATDTAQQAATAIGEQATSQRQAATEGAPKPPAAPAAPDTSDTSAPHPAKQAAGEPAPAKEAARSVSRKVDSAVDTATGTSGGVTQDVRDAASSGASSAASSATGTSDSLTRPASESAGTATAELEQKLGASAGSAGQASGSVRDGAQQIIAGAGADDLPPTGGLTGGGGSTPASPVDDSGILPTLLGGPTSGLPAVGGTNLLESGSGLPLVGPPGGGGSLAGGGGAIAPGGGGSLPGGGAVLPGGGAFTGTRGDGGSLPASTAPRTFSLLLTNSLLSSLGASFAATPAARAGSGSPAPGLPGHGPAPFAFPSLGGAFANGLVLAAGLLALLTIFFLMAPGLGRWIRTSAEKWPPPGLVSPIELPG